MLLTYVNWFNVYGNFKSLLRVERNKLFHFCIVSRALTLPLSISLNIIIKALIVMNFTSFARNFVIPYRAWYRALYHRWFSCHWIRIASIVFWLFLKRTQLNSNNNCRVYNRYSQSELRINNSETKKVLYMDCTKQASTIIFHFRCPPLLIGIWVLAFGVALGFVVFRCANGLIFRSVLV